MHPRTLANVIKKVNANFPALLITGPRQVGKTTLLEICKEHNREYVTLDDIDIRNLAISDPALFFQIYKPPIIIDEVQYAPNLFSYMKMQIDQKKLNGMFWLTGSQKFNLMKGITESLAGRIAVLDLLGFSQAEIEGKGELSTPFLPTPDWIDTAKTLSGTVKNVIEIYKRIWSGSFPKAYNLEPLERDIFYRSYIQTYIQRDVRDILNITDENAFHRFIGIVAARSGQLLNYADLARDTGIDNKTAKSWLSILETSGLVYLLQPYRTNLTKRLVKAPKLYFLDTGLCSYLTKWPNHEALEAGAMSGAILETYIFTEILRSYWHNGLEAHFYYYRDADQKEVDLLIEVGDTLYPIEFKKTATPSINATRHFQVLAKLNKKIGQGAVICLVEKHLPLSNSVIAIPVAYL